MKVLLMLILGFLICSKAIAQLDAKVDTANYKTDIKSLNEKGFLDNTQTWQVRWYIYEAITKKRPFTDIENKTYRHILEVIIEKEKHKAAMKVLAEQLKPKALKLQLLGLEVDTSNKATKSYILLINLVNATEYDILAYKTQGVINDASGKELLSLKFSGNQLLKKGETRKSDMKLNGFLAEIGEKLSAIKFNDLQYELTIDEVVFDME